jgi:hypothetical protein
MTAAKACPVEWTTGDPYTSLRITHSCERDHGHRGLHRCHCGTTTRRQLATEEPR